MNSNPLTSLNYSATCALCNASAHLNEINYGVEVNIVNATSSYWMFKSNVPPPNRPSIVSTDMQFWPTNSFHAIKLTNAHWYATNIPKHNSFLKVCEMPSSSSSCDLTNSTYYWTFNATKCYEHYADNLFIEDSIYSCYSRDGGNVELNYSWIIFLILINYYSWIILNYSLTSKPSPKPL